LRTVEVIAKNPDWFIALPAVVVIGRSKYFGINRELRHATFLSHGRTPEVYCFSISLVFTLPHVYFLSLFALVETITLKIWERPMLWLAKCSLPVAVRGSGALHAWAPYYLFDSRLKTALL